MPSTKDKVRVGILGASGYTGVELLRILAHHPNVIIDVLTADRQAGKKIGAVFPHLARHVLPDLVAIPEVVGRVPARWAVAIHSVSFSATTASIRSFRVGKFR